MTLTFKQQVLLEEFKKQNSILLENSCRGLTPDQEQVVRKIYNEFRPLIEATLTPDQIKQIFTGVEQGAAASGANRTGIGKAADVAKLPVQAVQKVNDIINKAGQWAQNTTPVQAFDQKFEDLKGKISAKFPNVAQNLTQAGEWAKANPGKTALIIGVLTALAALAGGPLGGAIAGQVLRGTKELMTGQKLSTAVGKGLKTAAMGFAAGKIFDAIKELIPPEVAKTFISSDGQQIDLTKIPGMSATDAASMSPEEIKELLQTQKALMTAAKSSLDGEVQQEITQAVQQVTQKINELGGANQLMQQAGIKGSDLTMQMMQATSDATGDVQTFTDAYTITADELQNVGINFATEPPISDAVKQWAQSKGLNVDALQKAFQMEKAMDDAQFLGTAIQSETAIETWASSGLPTPSVTSTDLKDTLVIGQQQSMNIVTKIPGLDKPIGLTTSFSIEGVDEAGNAVFKMTDVAITSKLPFEEIGEMDEQTAEQFRQYLNAYTGVGMDSQAGVITDVSTFKQDVAQSIGAAASAAAIAASVKDKPVQPAAGGATTTGSAPASGGTPTPESKIYRIFENIARQQQTRNAELVRLRNLSGIQEGIGDTIKKFAGQAAGKISQTAANLTNKVTADKLMKAWQAAGSPTDDAALANFLQGQGISQDIIDSSFTSSGLTAPMATASTGTAAVSKGTTAASAGTVAASTGTTAASAGTVTPKIFVKDITAFVKTLELTDLQDLQQVIDSNLSTRKTRTNTNPVVTPESIFYSRFLKTDI